MPILNDRLMSFPSISDIAWFRHIDEGRRKRTLFAHGFPVDPWRDRGRINPKTKFLVSCVVFQSSKISIEWRILPKPPAPACTKQNVMGDISSTEMMAS